MTSFSSGSTAKELETKYLRQLSKAITHLEYSQKKVITLPKRLLDNDEESLETWESFAARFSRVVDIFLTKFIKLKVKENDPGFDGTLRDFLNHAEKMKLISDVDRWMSTRELRNIQAHDYTEEQLENFLTALQTETEFVLKQLSGFKIAIKS
jgi:hypothetical protein